MYVIISVDIYYLEFTIYYLKSVVGSVIFFTVYLMSKFIDKGINYSYYFMNFGNKFELNVDRLAFLRQSVQKAA